MPRIDLRCGDCLQLLPELPDNSVDMILCDLPYNVTRNTWDSIIPLESLWEQYRRVIQPHGAICLFADGMFMADLMRSNPRWWRYNLVWDKALTSGFLNANRMPLRQHEEICVFYDKLPHYTPQKVPGSKSHSKGKPKSYENHNYGEYAFQDNSKELGDMKHPTSILTFQKTHPSKAVHPTEKPVPLCEWLIRTYTSPGEVVLDNAMGSGTTGVACVNTERHFIGMEKSEEYFAAAQARIQLAEALA